MVRGSNASVELRNANRHARVHDVILEAGKMRNMFAYMRSAGADDAGYFRNRALQEQAAAQKATCEAARDRHDQLAARCRFRALIASSRPQFGPEVTRERNAVRVG